MGWEIGDGSLEYNSMQNTLTNLELHPMRDCTSYKFGFIDDGFGYSYLPR